MTYSRATRWSRRPCEPHEVDRQQADKRLPTGLQPRSTRAHRVVDSLEDDFLVLRKMVAMDPGECPPPRVVGESTSFGQHGLGGRRHCVLQVVMISLFQRLRRSSARLRHVTVVPLSSPAKRFHAYITDTRARASDGSAVARSHAWLSIHSLPG